MESFEDSEKGLNRAWVKGGVVNPEKGILFTIFNLYVSLKAEFHYALVNAVVLKCLFL